MKSKDIDQLLSGLLGEPIKTKPEPKPSVPEEQKQPAASEKSRRRVEELMRSVELENSQRRAAEPQKPARTIPRREPIVVPPPISHFSEEPSQNPAVRMRDRLDETALPMLDAERKPTQVIPPKPKPETPSKKKKKRSADPDKAKKMAALQPSADIPVPQSMAPPKRKIPHIVVPDELPPDIPRDTSIADEIRRRKQEAAMQQETVAPVQIVEPEIPAEPESSVISEQHTESAPCPETVVASEEEKSVREQKILRKAEKIKQQIRLAMEEIQSVPDIGEVPEETEIPETEESDYASEIAEPESVMEESASESELLDELESEEEQPKKRRIGGFFRRKKEENSLETGISEASLEAETESIPEEIVPEESEENETEEEIPGEPEQTAAAPSAPRLRHLSMMDEPEEKSGLFGRFGRKKKQNLTKSDALKSEESSIYGENFDSLDAYVEPFIPPAVEYDTVPEEEEPEPEPRRGIPVHEPEPAPQPEESIHVSIPGEATKKQNKSVLSEKIRAALDENSQELADTKAEPIPDENGIDVKVGKSRFLRRNTYFVVGVLCSAFALVGVAVCVMWGIGLVRDFADSSSLKSELEDVLYPVAVVDLPEFENPADAVPENLMAAAVIDLLMYEDLSGYTEAFDVISIPAEDVRNHADAMFGTTLAGEYETLFAAGELFFYDESTGCYNVPVSPMIFSYAPVVEEIRSTEENVYILTVKYCSDTAQWQQRAANFSIAGEKNMEITLHKQGNDYQIVRIMNVSAQSDGV